MDNNIQSHDKSIENVYCSLHTDGQHHHHTHYLFNEFIYECVTALFIHHQITIDHKQMADALQCGLDTKIQNNLNHRAEIKPLNVVIDA